MEGLGEQFTPFEISVCEVIDRLQEGARLTLILEELKKENAGIEKNMLHDCMVNLSHRGYIENYQRPVTTQEKALVSIVTKKGKEMLEQSRKK